MPTLVELRKKARALELKGFSALKKPALEDLIAREVERRENEKLRAIRQAAGPGIEKIATEPLVPLYPLEVDVPSISAEDISAAKGKGISNHIRALHYLAQDKGRTKLTPAMARRMRKKRKAGDHSMALAACFPNVNVLVYL